MQTLRYPTWSLTTCVALLIFSSGVPGVSAAEPGFRAGAVAQDITPLNLPISVNGGMSDRLATSVHDRLHARCLVLDDGRTPLAIVVCDSCMLPREVLESAKQMASQATGIPTSQILISATHTHTAPTATGVFQSDANQEYCEFLSRQIAKGIATAHDNLVPAEVGWGVGQDPTQVFNRRWHMQPEAITPDPFGKTADQVKMNPGYQNPGLIRPAGPTDPDVSILSVRTVEGKPLALLANYSLHYVGGAPPLSADYFGEFARRIAEKLQASETEPAFVGIMSNGTSGDINNIDYSGPAPARQGPFEQIQRVAESVATVAHTTYEQIQHRRDITLAAAETDIELGVRLPSAEDVRRAEGILSTTTPGDLQGLEQIYARETVLLSKYPRQVPVKLQAFRIGELGITAIPCETFVEIGLKLKQESPLPTTFTIELANGYNGYLPTPEQHALGGYETWRARSSYLETTASNSIQAKLLKLLQQVAGE